MSFKKGNIKRMIAALCAFIVVSTFVIMPVSATGELPAVEGPQQAAYGYCVVTASVLNVRESADIDAPILTTLSMGARVKVHWIEENANGPDWVCVAYKGDGLRGYVSADYVVVHEGNMPEISSDGGQAAIDIAMQYLGVPYVYGGSSPSGFDCSGLVQYVYKQLGYDLHRVAASQMTNGIPIAKEDLAPGDLVGFYSSIGGSYVGHIGLYVGDGMMIHAPRTGDVVKIVSIADDTYHGKRFAGGRRIIY